MIKKNQNNKANVFIASFYFKKGIMRMISSDIDFL